MAAPRPGQRVRGSRSGRPIMAALDLLGRRWALRILWELREGALPFRALREAAGDVSPAVLNTRLAELRDAGLVESTDAGYATTDLGRELCVALEPLQAWARRWAGSSLAGRRPRRSAPSTAR
jgi:DNA-binding HxlR family transcriptional regulator